MIRMIFSSAICAGLLAIGADHAAAQTVAPGPYYAPPAWDQTLPAGVRFVVLSNFNHEAALDRETGLVWHRTPFNAANWADASDRCITLTTGNRTGWRLPSVNELTSLFDPSMTNHPPFPAGHPFQVPQLIAEF